VAVNQRACELPRWVKERCFLSPFLSHLTGQFFTYSGPQGSTEGFWHGLWLSESILLGRDSRTELDMQLATICNRTRCADGPREAACEAALVWTRAIA